MQYLKNLHELAYSKLHAPVTLFCLSDDGHAICIDLRLADELRMTMMAVYCVVWSPHAVPVQVL
jgi:hypothetical protein